LQFFTVLSIVFNLKHSLYEVDPIIETNPTVV